MNIALIGSGGREHALCHKIVQSDKVNKVFCIPGNAGTSKIAINIKIDALDFENLLTTIKKYKISLVIVGPEQPLVMGIVDFLEKNKIKVFGPNKYAAQLEGSKAFMKNLCKKNNIPTANYKVCKKKADVLEFLNISQLPVVVKADGLASGKGVTICYKKNEVIKVSEEIFLGKFKSSKKLVLEEFLAGEEASYFLIVDKKNFIFFGSAQDHKKVGEKETGPNTGGMGAYSPAPIIKKKIEKKIINRIIKPTLSALKKKGKPFTGFLYTGLMIKNNEPYLIEYNVRMGDPECQVIMPRLDTDIIKIINFSLKNNLDKIKVKWKKRKCMTVVLCSKGYPGNYLKNKPINNLNNIKLDKKSIIFHAGTKIDKKKLFSNGGRVLNVTSSGESFLKIRKKIFVILKKINWRHGFFRRDIGWRVI
ncbi:MAG: phosphoribosylamine--glycine ligase [Pelagibacteraceae bacterium TMED287]|nr:MAG: phosphoribosylamine--glycine ligase [Pelagibacteraceae bacterium TMED287]|tara:strand:+ start:7 stop:1266 length:1260 start_codon:yes stop_codon:yes gene_type:complete